MANELDLAAIEKELRYSPDQPRDEKGRFGSGEMQGHKDAAEAHSATAKAHKEEADNAPSSEMQAAHDAASIEHAKAADAHLNVLAGARKGASEKQMSRLKSTAASADRLAEHYSKQAKSKYDRSFDPDQSRAEMIAKFAEMGVLEYSYRYSEDQPRDEKGRFSSGSGSEALSPEGEIHGYGPFVADPRTATNSGDNDHESAANSHTDAAQQHEEDAETAAGLDLKGAAQAHMDAAEAHHAAALAHDVARKSGSKEDEAKAKQASDKAIKASGKAVAVGKKEFEKH